MPAAPQKIVTFLAFPERAEEAVRFYTSIFPNSRIHSIHRSDGAGPIPKGKLLSASFSLGGHEFLAMDGGEVFQFSLGISLSVSCNSQKEIDTLWRRLAAGGEPSRCGWLTDKFGIAWQIVPRRLGDMLTDPESGDSGAVMAAMLEMGKLDAGALERAYAGPPSRPPVRRRATASRRPKGRR